MLQERRQGRRFALVCWVAVFAAAALACGEGTTRRDVRTQTADARTQIAVGDAPALFEQDFRRSFDGSFFVAFDLTFTAEDGDAHRCTVQWWKDGTDRQRFDMCPTLLSGDEPDTEPWRILMFGDREQILVCSSRLPLNPRGELDSGDGGACHEDSFGIGDLAGNAVFYLNFPLEYPDELPAGYFDSIDEVAFEEAWSETIAGQSARCYAASAREFDDDEPVRVETCYADSGAIVHHSGRNFFEYTLRATAVGSVTDEDFDLPYPYVDAETD